MPDNVSTLEFPAITAPAASTTYGEVVVPYACDITDVIAVASSAVAVAALPFDIIKNPATDNVSIFAAAIGSIALKSPIGTTDTQVYFEFAGNAAPDIQPGAFLLIESEVVKVSTPVTSATGVTTGGLQGSSKVDGGIPVYSLGIVRAQEGTSAATHAANISVYPAKPQIAVGAVESALSSNPAWGQTPELAEGDILQLKTGAWPSGTGAANLQVSLEISQR